MSVGQIEKTLENDMGISGFRVEMLDNNGRRLDTKIKVKKLLKG